MTRPRADDYDAALTALFQTSGYDRVAPRIYARSEDDRIWHGLFISFYRKWGKLCAQPALAVYCPTASKIVERGLSSNYPPRVRDRSKLGLPIMVHILYDRILRHHGEDRHPFSYDIQTIDQISAAAELVHSDFLKVATDFFGHTRSLRDLSDEVRTRPTSTGAGMYAMALEYLINPKISAREIDACVRITPNPMTEKFATYFKAELGLS